MITASLEHRQQNTFVPTPEQVCEEIPFSDLHATFINRSRKAVEAILNGYDKRKLLIVGPCSIHDPYSAREYAIRLRNLAHQVSDQFLLIMRTYFEKSRTIVGWKGMLYDPDIDGSHNLTKGVKQVRQLLAELTEMEVPVGCELLEINTIHYYGDFLTWGCIGARTCSSPPHRQLAASLNLPIGFKNSTDGNIEYSIQGILAAAAPHVYLGLSPAGRMMRIQAEGNPFCHIILRGGRSGPNYQPDFVKLAIQKCQQAKVRDKIVIDCSHDNCSKMFTHQSEVFKSIIQQILEGNSQIVGIMLESHLKAGSQPIVFPLLYGTSITDPCINWESTEYLILQAYENLQKLQFYTDSAIVD